MADNQTDAEKFQEARAEFCRQVQKAILSDCAKVTRIWKKACRKLNKVIEEAHNGRLD